MTTEERRARFLTNRAAQNPPKPHQSTPAKHPPRLSPQIRKDIPAGTICRSPAPAPPPETPRRSVGNPALPQESAPKRRPGEPTLSYRKPRFPFGVLISHMSPSHRQSRPHRLIQLVLHPRGLVDDQ